MRQTPGTVLGVLLAALALAASGQESVGVPRADGAQVPLRVYAPADSRACPPIALISHGAGGSENGMRYLAEALRDNSLEGDWQVRTAAYEDLPPGCKWLGIIDGATHLDFAGDTGHVQNLVIATVNAFLNGAHENGRCSVPAASVGITLKMK